LEGSIPTSYVVTTTGRVPVRRTGPVLAGRDVRTRRGVPVMGWQDKVTAAVRKLSVEASKNQGSIERGIDKAARLADEKTGSRYSEQIRKGGEGLRSGLRKLTESAGGDSTPR
jgi:hypothetical protein